MTSEKVIELSVQETNEQMEKIGYKRLRVESNNEKTSDQISLSMEESNKLRSKLDQASLRETTEGQSEKKTKGGYTCH